MLKILSPPVLIVLFLSLFLSTSVGCGTPTEEAEAEVFLNRYFKYLEKQNFNAVHSMYNRSAFGVVSSLKAFRGIKKTMLSFGKLKSFKFDRGSTYIENNKDGGLSFKLSYDVVYQKMKTREGFIIRKSDDGRWEIISHTIERL